MPRKRRFPASGGLLDPTELGEDGVGECDRGGGATRDESSTWDTSVVAGVCALKDDVDEWGKKLDVGVAEDGAVDGEAALDGLLGRATLRYDGDGAL